jgi:hypothetical protein
MGLLFFISSLPATNVGSVSTQFSTLFKIERAASNESDGTRGKLIKNYYDNHIHQHQNPKGLAALTDDDLRTIFRDAYIAQFYTYDEKYVADMELDLDEITRRRIDTPELHALMHRAYIANRLFDKTKSMEAAAPDAFRLRFSDLAVTSKKSVMLVTDHHSLERRPMDFDHGIHVIVISSPLCHFTQHAITQIESDPGLAKAMATYSDWIVPPEGDLNIEPLLAWNNIHKMAPMKLMYKAREWSELSTLDTPSFYFYRDGKLAYQVIGWLKNGNMQALLKAFSALGIHIEE